LGISIKSAGYLDRYPSRNDGSSTKDQEQGEKNRIIEGGFWLAHEELRTLDLLVFIAAGHGFVEPH